ncbi:MAG: SNF2-related protein [Acidobacteriota bacterium]
MAEGTHEKRSARGQRRRSRKRPRAAAKPRPVPLYERAASHFRRIDRQRAQELVRDGQVLIDVHGTRARARVDGDDGLLGVGLNWSQVAPSQVLHVFCECRRFKDGRPCVHIFAGLVALAGDSPRRQPPGEGNVKLRRDRPSKWKDLAELTGSAAPASEEAPKRRVSTVRKRTGESDGAVRKPRAVQVTARSVRGAEKETWKAQLDTVRSHVDRLLAEAIPEDAAPDAADDGAEPGPSDLRFVVNLAASEASNGLVLDVFQGGPKAPKEPKPVSLDPRRFHEILLPPPTVPAPDEAEPASDEIEPESEAELRDAEVSELEPPDAEPPDAEPPDAEPPDAESAGSGSSSEAAAEEPVAVIAALPAERWVRQGGKRRTRGGKGKAKTPRMRSAKARRLLLPIELYDRVLSYLTRHGALGWWDGVNTQKQHPLSWDRRSTWTLALRVDFSSSDPRLRGALVRDGEAGREEVALRDPVLVLPGEGRGAGLVLFGDRLARFDAVPERDMPWIDKLRGDKDALVIPRKELEDAIAALLELPLLPRLEMPPELELTEEAATLQPFLVLRSEPAPEWMDPPLLAELSFLYGPLQVSASDPSPALIDWEEKRYAKREMESERAALVRLVELGLRPVSSDQGHGLELSPDELPSVAEPLLSEGWAIEVHGNPLRPPSPSPLKVESGIDWFELSGDIDFAGKRIDLSTVLAASARGDRFIELDDGSRGLLPTDWLETYDSLSKLAVDSSDEGLRFLPSQALLVDALLVGMPPKVDRPFARLREKLQSMERIKPKKELKSFNGTLRQYQRQGLGWLDFLREFGLGGVLADDMGLGKTVQVLALIHSHRTAKKSTGLPFLVVAPRSLVYNWLDEARNFTPKLKVMEYAGPDRESLREAIGTQDLVLTTYGTLRRDVAYLATVEFDTVILDEAQAIKNRESQAAKASRLLNGQHRLALTGTPIENHLGELGSIFEFLNPGLFGRLPRLDALSSGRTPSQRELKLVSEGLRPFILRRTKAQVLPDLPPKTEQTLHTTLNPRQRELYDQLRLHYQESLLATVEGQGMGGSALQVLEALLRLRQVACHPGLVDPEWDDAGSSKLEALFSQVSEVLEEGHKAIVFSQFTKLLGYVRRELETREIPYAYLDGQTRKRGEVVDRFQNDPDCNLFLISIKAGGTGLNLTAAGYVFLLDPWWNPAVEAQAIDRAHRIGQVQPVFAYRLIARDTVEEKILELQRSKRELADAILEGGGQTISDLTADDLRLLLS